jgi:DNA polymerase-3 subunit alpha
MVFPQMYTQVSTSLIEDSVVIVRSRVDRGDDEALRVIAMEVTTPDLSEATSGPVRISLQSSRCISPLVDRLDHHTVNDVIPNSTSENLAVWFWDNLIDALPNLDSVRVHETARAYSTYRGA